MTGDTPEAGPSPSIAWPDSRRHLTGGAHGEADPLPSCLSPASPVFSLDMSDDFVPLTWPDLTGRPRPETQMLSKNASIEEARMKAPIVEIWLAASKPSPGR